MGKGGKGDGFFSPVWSNPLSRKRLGANSGVNDHLELLTIDYLLGRRAKSGHPKTSYAMATPKTF